jgi:hypothetical protein
MDIFQYQHVEVCLLAETNLRSGEAFRMTKYVSHHTDWLTEGGGTAILVHRFIDHYAITV